MLRGLERLDERGKLLLADETSDLDRVDFKRPGHRRHQRLRLRLTHAPERAVERPAAFERDQLKVHFELFRGIADLVELEPAGVRVILVVEQRHPFRAGNQLLQVLQALRTEYIGVLRDSCHVAPGPGVAADEFDDYGIVDEAEDDRNRVRRAFRRACLRRRRCIDDGHAFAHQFVGQAAQLVHVAIGKALQVANVLAFRIAQFLQAFLERIDRRPCRLLRGNREDADPCLRSLRSRGDAHRAKQRSRSAMP